MHHLSAWKPASQQQTMSTKKWDKKYTATMTVFCLIFLVYNYKSLIKSSDTCLQKTLQRVLSYSDNIESKNPQKNTFVKAKV